MATRTERPLTILPLTLSVTSLPLGDGYYYPVFRGTASAITINVDIQGIIGAVQCVGDGSRYLEVKTQLLSDRSLSLRYASAVMCETGHREGFASYRKGLCSITKNGRTTSPVMVRHLFAVTSCRPSG